MSDQPIPEQPAEKENTPEVTARVDEQQEVELTEEERVKEFERCRDERQAAQRADTLKKSMERQLIKDALETQLQEAMKRKKKYEVNKQRLDEALDQRLEKEAAQRAYAIEKAKLVPTKDAPSHLWTEDEIRAREEADELDRETRIFDGKPRKLTKEEKTEMLNRAMNSSVKPFRERTFYEDNPDWFAFETRLKDMMLAMVEPLVRKGLLDATYVAKVIKNQAIQDNKLDEFNYLLARVVKSNTKQDDFAASLHEYETRTLHREAKLEDHVRSAKRIEDHCAKLLEAIKGERLGIIKQIDGQNEAVEKYNNDLAMAKVRMDANIEKATNAMKETLTMQNVKIDAMRTLVSTIEVKQKNISANFVSFGAEIEQQAHDLKKLQERIQDLRYRKVDRQDFIDQNGMISRDVRCALANAEEALTQIAATDRYIKMYEPINMVTEVTRLLKDLFPRRRHREPLEKIVRARQNELVTLLDERHPPKLNKTEYELATFPPITKMQRKQSATSDYIRDVVHMYQQEKGLKGCSKHGRVSRTDKAKRTRPKIAASSVAMGYRKQDSLADSGNTAVTPEKRKGVPRRQKTSYKKSLTRLTVEQMLTKSVSAATNQATGGQSPMVGPPGKQRPDMGSEGSLEIIPSASSRSSKRRKKRRSPRKTMVVESEKLAHFATQVQIMDSPHAADHSCSGHSLENIVERSNDAHESSSCSHKHSDHAEEKQEGHQEKDQMQQADQLQLPLEKIQKIDDERIKGSPAVKDIMDRLRELELFKYREKEQQQQKEKKKAEDEALGSDGKSERLSTIKSEDSSERRRLNPPLRRTKGRDPRDLPSIPTTEEGKSRRKSSGKPSQRDSIRLESQRLQGKGDKQSKQRLKEEAADESPEKPKPKAKKVKKEPVKKKPKTWKKAAEESVSRASSPANMEPTVTGSVDVQKAMELNAIQDAQSPPIIEMKAAENRRIPERPKTPPEFEEQSQPVKIIRKEEKEKQVRQLNRQEMPAKTPDKPADVNAQAKPEEQPLQVTSIQTPQAPREQPRKEYVQNEESAEFRRHNTQEVIPQAINSAKFVQGADTPDSIAGIGRNLLIIDKQATGGPTTHKGAFPEEKEDASPIIDINIPTTSIKGGESGVQVNQSNEQVDENADEQYDEAGDYPDDGKEVRFVTTEELDGIKKEISECHTANEALRSFITDVQSDLHSFRSRMGELSWSTYETDAAKATRRAEALDDRLGATEMMLHQRIDEVEQQEFLDRKLIWTEGQATNRRVLTAKKEIRQDFEVFSRVFKEQDRKLLNVLQSAQSLCKLADLLQEVLLLQGSLIRQDEMDKKAIFLMGVRHDEQEQGLTRGQLRSRQLDRLHEHYGEQPDLTLGEQHKRQRDLGMSACGEPPQHLISLSDRCLSCSDQPRPVVQAFKLACLSYKPSLVPYQNTQLSRDNMILLQDEIMSHITANKDMAQALATALDTSLRESMDPDSIVTEMLPAAKAQVTQDDRGFVRAYTPQLTENDAALAAAVKKQEPFADSSTHKMEMQMEAQTNESPEEKQKQPMSTERGVKSDNSQEPETDHLPSAQAKFDRISARVKSGMKRVEKAQAEKLKEQARMRVRVATSTVNRGHAVDVDGKRVKIDEIANSNRKEQRLAILGLSGQDMSTPGSKDIFSNTERALLNAEVRDWADRMYHDNARRDMNGNIDGGSIGTAIDAIDTRPFYENDSRYKEHLTKLAKIRRKSAYLYRKGTLAKRKSDQIMLPLITTPLQRPGSNEEIDLESDLRLDAVTSHKTQYDIMINNRSRVQKIREMERRLLTEAETPAGAGRRSNARRAYRSQEFTRASTAVARNPRASFSSHTPFMQNEMKRVAKAEIQDRLAFERNIRREMTRSQDLKAITQYSNRGFYARLHEDEQKDLARKLEAAKLAARQQQERERASELQRRSRSTRFALQTQIRHTGQDSARSSVSGHQSPLIAPKL